MRIITIPIPSWAKHHRKRRLNDRVLLMTDWRNHTTELERVNNQIDLIAQRAKNTLGFIMVEKGIWKQIWRLNVVNTFKSIKSSLRLPQRPQWSLENSGYWISLGILHKWTHIGLSSLDYFVKNWVDYISWFRGFHWNILWVDKRKFSWRWFRTWKFRAISVRSYQQSCFL